MSVNCQLGMWGQIKVVPYGAETLKVDKSKYKLTMDETIPKSMLRKLEQVKKDILNFF